MSLKYRLSVLRHRLRPDPRVKRTLELLDQCGEHFDHLLFWDEVRYRIRGVVIRRRQLCGKTKRGIASIAPRRTRLRGYRVVASPMAISLSFSRTALRYAA